MNIKKIAALCLGTLVLCGLVGCGSDGKKAEVTAPAKAQAAEVAAPAQSSGNSSTLIVYFSHSGNTDRLAKMLQKGTGADMFRVVPVEAYPTSYHAVIDQAKKEQQANARPALKTLKVEKLDKYNTVFVGYPNWWGTMPMCMFTFLENNDLSGKKLVPFVTHEGSAFGSSLDDLKRLAPNAKLQTGIEVRGGQVGDSENEVANWLKKEGYSK